MHNLLKIILIFGLIVGINSVTYSATCIGKICINLSRESNSSIKDRLESEMNQKAPLINSYGILKYSAEANFDLKPKTMQKIMPGEDENYFAISNLNAKGQIAIISGMAFDLGVGYFKSNKGQGDSKATTGFILEDAYITLGNTKNVPIYFQAGRSYLPFGQYNRYVITPSLVQMLTETQAENIQLGFTQQFHKSAIAVRGYMFQGVATKDHRKHQGDLNGGVAVSTYLDVVSNVVIYGGVQYIYNMLDINAIVADGVFKPTSFKPIRNALYTDRAAAIAWQAHIRFYNTLELFVKRVSACKSSIHIRHHRNKDTNINVVGAKPSAWELGTSLDAIWGNVPFSLDFSYQLTKDTAGLFVFNNKPVDEHPFPRIRYIIGANIDINKHTRLTIQWGHNFLYRAPYDSGRQGDDATIRLSVFV